MREPLLCTSLSPLSLPGCYQWFIILHLLVGTLNLTQIIGAKQSDSFFYRAFQNCFNDGNHQQWKHLFLLLHIPIHVCHEDNSPLVWDLIKRNQIKLVTWKLQWKYSTWLKKSLQNHLEPSLITQLYWLYYLILLVVMAVLFNTSGVCSNWCFLVSAILRELGSTVFFLLFDNASQCRYLGCKSGWMKAVEKSELICKFPDSLLGQIFLMREALIHAGVR